MSIHNECNSCPLLNSPVDHLLEKMALLTLAVEGAYFLLADSQSGYPQAFASGLKTAMHDAEEAINRYAVSKGDQIVEDICNS